MNFTSQYYQISPWFWENSNRKEGKMFACGYIINFNDGGESEEQILHKGTLEECQEMAKLITAVSYSGDRPIKDCEFVIVPLAEDSK